jgi:hypothetical protein
MSTDAELAEPETWTLAELATRLESARRNGTLLLAGSTLGAQEVDDVLGALGLTQLELDDPQVEQSADSMSVEGKASLLGLPQVDGHATFFVADGALSVLLAATLPPETRLQLLGLPWASIGDVALAVNVVGPSLPVPVATVVMSGAIELQGQADPIRVTLTPSAAGPDWLLRATDIPLPDLAALTDLLAGQEADTVMPPTLGTLKGFEIVELSCAFDPSDWSVRSLAATIGAPGQEWEFASGLPTLRDVSLSVGLEFEGAADEDVVDEDGGDGAGATGTGVVKSVTASAGATVTLGKLVDLPVRISREPDQWRMGILGAHGFPSVGELVAAAADAKTAAMLPTGLGELRMETASLELTLGSGDPTLRSIFFSTRLADEWPIVEGHLALERVALQVLVDRAGGDTSGFFTGSIRVEDFELPVAVEKPGASAPWTLKLGSDAAPTLSGVSSLASVMGGDVAAHMPAGFGDAALSLRDLSMSFDPETHSVSTIAVEVHSDGPWSLPELNQFDVRDLTVKLRVDSPGDSDRRAVTGTISGTVDLAGAAIKLRASKVSADAPWELEGTLAPTGPPLDLTALTQRALPGEILPAGVPSLALSTVDLKVTPATGAFALTAGSPGPWPVPIGFKGVTISDLDLELRRAASGADLTGTFGGRFTVATSELRVTYTLPGDLVLSGHVESMPVKSLVDELVGPGFDALPLPDSFKALELPALDFSLAPMQGRFFASAKIPDFDAAAVLLQRSSQGVWGFALALAPASSWRLSTIWSGLAVLDDLSFGNTVLILSTADDASAVGDLPVVRDRLKSGALSVGPGLTLMADLSLDGTGAEHVLGMHELRVRAAIASPESLMLEAVVGGPFDLGENVVLDELDFRLTVGTAGPVLGLLGRIDVVLDPSHTLKFTGGLAVTPNELRCAVTMDGTWDEPFGAKGVSVSNLALELDWSYEGLPGIGLAGHTAIGTFHGDVAVKFDPGDPSQSMVAVSFDSLKLGDVLASLCHEVFQDAIPPEIVKTVFDISFEDVEIYVVPRDTKIGELEYKQGTRLNARMFFWGLAADAHVEIDYVKGLVVDGQVDPIELGDVFTLKGAGDEPKPKLHLEITTGKLPTIDVEGAVSLLGLTSETKLSLSDTSFLFETSGKIFDLFTCDLKVTGGHLGDTNGFFVEASMTNDLFAYLRQEATAAIQAAAKSADAGIVAAEKDVQDAQAKLSALDDQIAARRRTIEAEREDTRRTLTTAQTATVRAKQQLVSDLNDQIDQLYASIQADRLRDTQTLVDAQRDVQAKQGDVDSLLAQIDGMRATIQGERDLATRRVAAAQADVDAAQANVDSILGTIHTKEAWWNGLPDADWPWNESKARAGVWYYPMIGGLYTAYGTATGVLQGYRGVLDGIKAGAQFTPIEADPRIAGLYTAYYTATAALTTGQGVLEAAKAVQTLPPIDADPRLVALYAARGTAQAALDTAVAALTVIQSAGDAIPIDLDPEIVSLTAAKGVAQGVLTAAEGVLEGTRVTVGGALEVSEYIAKGALGGLFDVRKASFSGGLDALHGGQVRLAADVEFLGEPQHVEFGFDFNDLESSVESLVKELLPA